MKSMTASLMIAVTLTMMAIAPARCQETASADQMVKLSQLPDTPYLTPFAGKMTAAKALSRRRADGGIWYSISFWTPYRANQVIDWYKTSLKQYGWEADNAGLASVYAHHGANVSANVTVTGLSSTWSRVELTYAISGRTI
jgi:hypothetical protein